MCYNSCGLSLQGEIKMRKIFLFPVLILVFMFYLCGSVYANTADSNVEEDRVISEIGVLVNQGKYKVALEKTEDSISKYPESAFLYYWKATILSSLGDKKAAVENFNKSIELNPENVGSYVLRGICKYALNDYDGALADYNKAIELDPHNISAYNMRAGLKLQIGDLDGAVKDFDYIDSLKPEVQKSN